MFNIILLIKALQNLHRGNLFLLLEILDEDLHHHKNVHGNLILKRLMWNSVRYPTTKKVSMNNGCSAAVQSRSIDQLMLCRNCQPRCIYIKNAVFPINVATARICSHMKDV